VVYGTKEAGAVVHMTLVNLETQTVASRFAGPTSRLAGRRHDPVYRGVTPDPAFIETDQDAQFKAPRLATARSSTMTATSGCSERCQAESLGPP